MSSPEKVDAVRLGTSASKPTYTTGIKKKNPWENIGAALNNIQANFQQYIDTRDVSCFGKGNESGGIARG